MSLPTQPAIADLPTPARLLRATLTAFAVATVLLVAVVLPAEYGVDITGVGRVIGLTEMGEIKQQLAREAATAEAAEVAAAQATPAAPQAANAPSGGTPTGGTPTGGTPVVGTVAAPSVDSSSTVAPSERADTVMVPLAPNQGKEVKLVMRKGAASTYSWRVEGGAVNFDTHGDSTGAPKSYIGYKKGTRVEADSGTLVAAMDGAHGWFWRNRSGRAVVVRLIVSGEYTEVKKFF